MQTRTTECGHCAGHGYISGYACSDCRGSGEVLAIDWPAIHPCRHAGIDYIVETESYADGVAWTATWYGVERSGTARDVEEALADAREWVQLSAMAVAS